MPWFLCLYLFKPEALARILLEDRIVFEALERQRREGPRVAGFGDWKGQVVLLPFLMSFLTLAPCRSLVSGSYCLLWGIFMHQPNGPSVTSLAKAGEGEKTSWSRQKVNSPSVSHIPGQEGSAWGPGAAMRL